MGEWVDKPTYIGGAIFLGYFKTLFLMFIWSYQNHRYIEKRKHLFFINKDLSDYPQKTILTDSNQKNIQALEQAKQLLDKGLITEQEF